MNQLIDQTAQLKERIGSLTQRVVTLVNTQTEPSLISRLKRKFTEGLVVTLALVDEQNRISHGTVRTAPNGGLVEATVAIDIILDKAVSSLSYHFNNLDLRVAPAEVVGVIYSESGVVRVTKMKVSVKDHRYHLLIDDLRQMVPDRYLVVFELKVGLDNYRHHPVTLQHLPSGGPGSGIGSR